MQAWENFLKSQIKEIGQDAVHKWLKPFKVLRYDAGNLYLEAKDTFQALWFEEHIRPKTSNLLNNNNRPIKIHISIANQGRSAPKKREEGIKQPPAPQFKIAFEELAPYNTFEHFTVHEGNLLAHKLLSKVAATTEMAVFNPIYLYGPAGSGKTHLMMATAQALKEQGLIVRYARTETFTEHVVAAIRAGEMSAFRQAYRTIDVLLLDDVHVFSRKRATQEEFFHSFNALHLAGKQIILSANVPPAELQNIEPRLVSRFEWGIVLSLERPDAEASKKIIQQKAQGLKFPISARVIEFLVGTFKSSPKALARGLEALILRTHLQNISTHHSHSENLSIAQVRHQLADLIREEERHTVTSQKIIECVAEQYELEIEAITGKEQSRECVLPRQVSMYLCRHQLKMSFTKIGDLFSRDHSTVMTSVKRVQKGLDEDEAELLIHYNAIVKRLGEL